MSFLNTIKMRMMLDYQILNNNLKLNKKDIVIKKIIE